MKTVTLFLSFFVLLQFGCSQSNGPSGKELEQTSNTFNAGSDALATFQSAKSNVIVHMFNYPYDRIVGELATLDQAGVAFIQISPPQLSNGGPWWGRSQPLEYRIIDGPLGNESQLKNLIDEAEKRGIGIIADLVLNHMANLGPNFDLSYPPQFVRDTYGVGGLFQASDFKPAYCITEWWNREHVINGRLCGGPGD